ncbi:MAG: glycosyltransferase family 4 protein, partial [Desulfobacterales bacterium]|nr:glycosyltransferase family 4 protein [Desulfobacterales bacterium]
LLEWLDTSAMGYPEPMTFGMRVKRHMRNRRNNLDIIHDNQSLSYGMLSLAKEMPVTATIHHPMTVDRRLAVRSTRSFFKKVKALRWYSFIGMQKRVARRLPAIITVSDSSKRDISREFKIPESRFRTIPIGIDMDNFYPLDHIRKVPGRLIVTNSADTPLKGLYHLLHALKGVLKKREASLTVIGTPKKGGGIEKLVKTLDLGRHIDFTGRVDHDRFVREYARASIAVVPSMYEGFGLPVGEAMACRIPVISTTGGALPEVAGNAARLVPPGDAQALEKAIIELLDDPARREALAQKGYERVCSEFTWEKTAMRTAAAYQEVINDYNGL